jgi:hypothetical protein
MYGLSDQRQGGQRPHSHSYSQATDRPMPRATHSGSRTSYSSALVPCKGHQKGKNSVSVDSLLGHIRFGGGWRGAHGVEGGGGRGSGATSHPGIDLCLWLQVSQRGAPSAENLLNPGAASGGRYCA